MNIQNNLKQFDYGRKIHSVNKSDPSISPYLISKPTHMGEGVMDIIKGVIDAGKFAYKHKDDLVDLYTGPLATEIRNLIPSSDETARPGFTGEAHAILKLKKGGFGIGNFCGPGTRVIERIKRGDPPRTLVDAACEAHDIRYSLAKTPADIRRADKIMINKVNQISDSKSDSKFNIRQARLIEKKVLAEDVGILDPEAFSGDLSKSVSKSDKKLMTSKLNELALEGNGFLPGDALKLSLLKQLSRDTRKSKNPSKFKLIGNGITKEKIVKFLSSDIVPKLMDLVEIPKNSLPIKMIYKLIKRALNMAKSANLSKITSHLSKAILPVLTAMKLKQMTGKFNGSGIQQVLGKGKNKLLSSLSKGLLSAFKWLINKNAILAGKSPIFGSGLEGEGAKSWFKNFWKGFKKGFRTVFKPGAKILSSIASAVGVPEIGIPLKIIGEII